MVQRYLCPERLNPHPDLSNSQSFSPLSIMVETKENVCLICIDGTCQLEKIRTNGQGWGISPPDGNPKGDAIKNANTPVMDKFEKEEPFCELEAHGLAVGLPDGLMGNSEGITPTWIVIDDSRTFEHRCR